MYYFDDYGWLTQTVLPERSTSIEPPAETDTLKANWTGLEWVLVPYVAPPAPVAPTPPAVPWTKKEFLLKFTPAEYAAIKSTAAANATLDYYWSLFTVADFVDKTDEATIAGINLLETAGLIATGRATEILS